MARSPRVAVARWETVAGEQIEAYWRRLEEAGLEPVDKAGPDLGGLNGASGLVLTGGIDVDPACYRAAPQPRTQTPNPDRDAFERALLDEALAHDLPVLAICRGFQLLNVSLEGSLLQHVESGEHAAQRDEARTSRSHAVSVEPGSCLHGWLGAESLVVNSRHHQAVTPDGLSPRLKPVALSEDGLVEAVESEVHAWVVGVQWHPERLEPQLEGFASGSARLFAAFAAAARPQ